LVREKFPQVELIVPGRNLGFAAGCNAAAARADADYVLLLNPDTVVLEHGVDVVVEFARANPRYGLYGGRAFRPDGLLERSSCWGAPSLWSMLTFAVGLSSVARHHPLFDPESLGAWQRDTVREVGVITGCFLLVEETLWRKLGGLDERYFMYGEDADFSARAWKLGFRPVICPDARFMHEVGMSSATRLDKALLLYRGKACYVRSHWSGLRQSLGLGLLLLGVWLRGVGEQLRGKGKSPVSGSPWLGLWRARREWLPGYPANRADPSPPGSVSVVQ
jgi:GT2 family glycosyltransferase